MQKQQVPIQHCVNWRIQKLIICIEKSRFHQCGTVPLNDRLATTLLSTGTVFPIIIAPVNQPTAMPFVYTSLLQISLSPEQAQMPPHTIGFIIYHHHHHHNRLFLPSLP